MRNLIYLVAVLIFSTLASPASAKMCAWFGACEGGRCGAVSGAIWTSGATCGLPLEQSGAGQSVKNMLARGYTVGWCECQNNNCNRQHDWVRAQWARTRHVPSTQTCPR